jgi:hypothetical protein
MPYVCSAGPFAVFSAVSGLELSMEKEQHKCRLNPFFDCMLYGA